MPLSSHLNHSEKKYTYGPADYESLELACGWLTFEEYAKDEKMSVEDVERDARKGKLGPIQIHPKTGKQVIIWPPGLQHEPLSKLPKPGIYQVKTRIISTREFELDIEDLEKFDEIQKTLLYLAHSVGESDKLVEKSTEILNHSCFLLQWVVFEVFLRSTIFELFKMHPLKLASDPKIKKQTLTYEELVQMTDVFLSADKLLHVIIDREIERQQSGGLSVHGLINFMKSEFKFKDDPYKSWYVLDGKKHQLNYDELIEIKEVRNALVHDAGHPAQTFFEKYPKVPNRDNRIIITDKYYQKAVLVIRSIAYMLSRAIEKGHYDKK